MSAKDIQIRGIPRDAAVAFVKRHHYSGKVDPRSQVHLGVFYRDRLEGVMQFGPSIDKAKSQGLVRDTSWNGFIELHRMAFSDVLPRNSESRAIGVAMRMLRKKAPHIEWCLSYADGTQCGDGTIYRASGFHLLKVSPNNSMWRMPDGEVICKIVLEPGFGSGSKGENNVKARYNKTGSETSTQFLKRIGAECLGGFQLKYIYFLNPEARDRLTVPILPFSEIDRVGARLYRGQRPGSTDSDATTTPGSEAGASPSPGLEVAV